MATITARVDDSLKLDFNKFCDDIGINASSLINMFLKACIREQKIPMEISSISKDMRNIRNIFDEMHHITSKNNPWKSEKEMIEELANDRRNR